MTERTEPVTVPAELPAAPAEVDGTASKDDAAVAPRPRRRRRGGRGRGGKGRTSASAAVAAGVPADRGVSVAEVEAVGGSGGPDAAAAPSAVEGEVKPAAPKRRRRRGGRGRGGKGRTTAAGAGEGGAEEGTPAEAIAEPPAETGVPAEGASKRAEGAAAASAARRRRPRSSGTAKTATGEPGTEGEEPRAADTVAPKKPAPPKTRTTRTTTARPRSRAKPKAEAVPEEAPAEPAPEAPARAPARRTRRKAVEIPAGEAAPAAPTAAPTRLRRGRQTGGRRRREPLPVVPRVTDKLMVITEHGERDQIAVLEGRDLVQHYVTRVGARSMVGNVYLGRIQNVLPGMEAAFVDVGRGRNAVLYAGEVNYSPDDLESGAPPRIEQVLKGGQSVVVQVTKDPIGGKGARLTAQISMPGRYLVLVPDSGVTGISRRLPDEERRRLKVIMRKVRPEGHGIIVRTAAEGADEEALAADVRRLLEEWAAIEKKAKKSKAPAVLYEEPELTVRAVRDLFNDEEFRELVTDSTRVYQAVTQYLAVVAPELLLKVRLHQGKLPVFEEFHIVEQIHKGLDRKVWLPSGGYLVIDRTEALTVIDVNTGKSVGKTNLEETVVNTNVEAAREVAHQLRLRDIGGMIIIDFIDMLLEQNKKRVIDALKEELARDKTRSQVFDISPLGLLEVTRKRVSGGLLESFSETCPTCEGRGVLLTYDVS
jgi:ribonuclease E